MPTDAHEAPDLKFWAFISYSHTDRAWADWLHRALERYRIPRRLVGITTAAGVVPLRISPVFLDRVDLAASADLDATIADALHESRSLVVICSPAATHSLRVSQEIDAFRSFGSGRMLSLIVAGRPNAQERGGSPLQECFPLLLRGTPTPGSRDSVPMAADVRPGNGGRQEALLKLIAGILNLNLDQLRQRDTQRRRLGWAAATTVCLLGMVCASALGLYAWGQRNAAVQAESGLLIQTASQRLKDADLAGAQGIVLDVLGNPKFAQGHTAAAINLFQEVRAADAQIAVLSGHRDFVMSAVYSPDGTRIVTASDDATARIWDARTGAELLVLAGHAGSLTCAMYSPDGTRIVTSSADKTARIWDARTGAQLSVLTGHSDRVEFAAYSPDGARIVTASNDKTVRIWDARTGAQLLVLLGHDDRVQSAAYSPDGAHIVTASWDKTARIWDARTGAQVAVLSGHGNFVRSAVYSPDGTRIVTASWDKTARIWDAGNGAQLSVLSGHTNFVESVVYSPDGTRIVTASHDRTLRIWDARTGAQLAVLSGHPDRLESAAYSPDGARIVSASLDNTARIWDARTGAQLKVLAGHDGSVGSAGYSPDNTHILTASADKTARIWDARTGVQLSVLSGHGASIASAAYSPDGAQIATASYDRYVRIWDARSGAQLAELSGHSGTVFCAAYSPDGTRIVTTSGDKTARIWEVRTATQIAVLSGHTGSVQWAAYSPDGSRIVTASLDKTARVWDARTGAQLAVLSGHSGSVASAAYSRDGRRIVTGSTDKTARIWDARTGAQLVVLSGHSGVVESVASSPDSAHIVTASSDNTIRIWDADTGTQLALLSGHGNVVETATYSSDGTRIVSASDDKTARIWDARIPATIATQVMWYRSAEIDPLSEGDRIQLGILDSHAKDRSSEGSACDRSAAAFYDPNRLAQGVSQTNLNIDIANKDCAHETAIPNHTARSDYQMGRALLAKRDLNGARRQFEAAATSYPIARVDLATLLTDKATDSSNYARAISLYESAWADRVSIAAYLLGTLYEHGGSIGASVFGLSPDLTRAWYWYQKGADAGQPHALARFAERDESDAMAQSDASRRNSLWLAAFRNYAAAAARAKKEDWPEDAWKHWRYRRATLARLLAREGMMQAVADAYRQEQERAGL